MQELSLIAPQHPKKDMKKMIEPNTMMAIGIIVGLFSGKTASISPSLNSGMAPAVIKAIPAICKIEKKNKIIRHQCVVILSSVFFHNCDKQKRAFMTHKMG